MCEFTVFLRDFLFIDYVAVAINTQISATIGASLMKFGKLSLLDLRQLVYS